MGILHQIFIQRERQKQEAANYVSVRTDLATADSNPDSAPSPKTTRILLFILNRACFSLANLYASTLANSHLQPITQRHSGKIP